MQPFIINQGRVDKAVRVLNEKWAILTGEQRLLVFSELNLHHCIYYDQDGALNFTGTDLQVVAIAAAFVAVAETGGILADA